MIRRRENRRLRELVRREWNWYRANYDTLSFKDKKLIHKLWYYKYPKQRCYLPDLPFFIKGIETITSNLKKENIKVLELGGREGSLALDILSKHLEVRWTNLEIIEHRAVEQLSNYSYEEHVLEDQLWDTEFPVEDYDVFLSAATLEHLSNKDLESLLEHLMKSNIEYLLMSISIEPEGQELKDVNASHVCTIGSTAVKTILEPYYEVIAQIDERKWCSLYRLRRNR